VHERAARRGVTMTDSLSRDALLLAQGPSGMNSLRRCAITSSAPTREGGVTVCERDTTKNSGKKGEVRDQRTERLGDRY
jgi:hypothetical protein